MEALYEAFYGIPVSTAGFQGLVYLVVLAGIVIFKLRIPRPEKGSS